MTQTLDIATRKGLFTLGRARPGEPWAISRVSFLGEPVTMTMRDPRDGAMLAALNLGHFGVKVHRSADGGESWSEVATPAYPPQPELAEPAEGEPKPVEWKLRQIWELQPGGADQPGRIWCGTLPGGLFVSDDGGDSWALNRALWDRPERAGWFGGGYDWPGIHSICIDPRNGERITCGVSCGGVWQTEDGGRNWSQRARGMFAEYMPPERRNDPEIQDPHLIAACGANPDAMWAQHHNGVFRSVDGAQSWTHVPNIRPSGFGFAVAVHPGDPDTAWFVPGVKDECRVPVDGRLVVARTRDGGESFDVLGDGLPSEHAYDLVYRHALALDESGESLVMGTTTGNLFASDDGGDTWRTVSTSLPPVYSVRFG